MAKSLQHRADRAARWILGAALFAALAAAILAVIFSALDRRPTPAPATNLTYLRQVQIELTSGRQGMGDRDVFHVAFLGDSTADAIPTREAVPVQLANESIRLAGGRREIRVTSLARPGTGPLDYYLVSDVIAGYRPDLVVIHFNPAALSDHWRTIATRPELAGWIHLRRLGEALTLPLHLFGLPADELVLYTAIVRLGLEHRWEYLLRRRVLLARAWAGLRSAAWRRFRQKQLVVRSEDWTPDGKRFRPGPQRAYYGGLLEGLDDHPVFELLGATVRNLTRSGTPVFVYVIPINVEYLRSIGLLDPAALARSLATIERTVTDAGGEFHDYHDLLPDEAFNDPGGHFVARGGQRPHRLLAELLAPHVVRRALRSTGDQ